MKPFIIFIAVVALLVVAMLIYLARRDRRGGGIGTSETGVDRNIANRGMHAPMIDPPYGGGAGGMGGGSDGGSN